MLTLDCDPHDESKWDVPMLYDFQKKKRKKEAVTAHYIMTYRNIFKSAASLFMCLKSSQQVEEVRSVLYRAANLC